MVQSVLSVRQTPISTIIFLLLTSPYFLLSVCLVWKRLHGSHFLFNMTLSKTWCSQRYSHHAFPWDCLMFLHFRLFSCCKTSITACVRKPKYLEVTGKSYLSQGHSLYSHSFCKHFACLFKARLMDTVNS